MQSIASKPIVVSFLSLLATATLLVDAQVFGQESTSPPTVPPILQGNQNTGSNLNRQNPGAQNPGAQSPGAQSPGAQNPRAQNEPDLYRRLGNSIEDNQLRGKSNNGLNPRENIESNQTHGPPPTVPNLNRSLQSPGQQYANQSQMNQGTTHSTLGDLSQNNNLNNQYDQRWQQKQPNTVPERNPYLREQQPGNTQAGSNVRPVGYQQDPMVNTRVAEQILKRMSVEKLNGALPGEPIGLVDAIANTTSNKRKGLIESYWNTYAKYLELRFAQEQITWLNRLAAPMGQADKVLLNAARVQGRTRYARAELEFEMAQGKLAEFFTENLSESLPLPKDIPLVGSYRTNFELFQAKQTMPKRLAILNRLIPQQYDLIHAQARSIQVSNNAANQVTTAYNQGQATLAATLEAIRINNQAHNDFAVAVNHYNQTIAKYALSVAPLGQQPHVVAGMLIPDVNLPIDGTPINEMNNSDQINEGMLRQASNSSSFGDVTQPMHSREIGESSRVASREQPLYGQGNTTQGNLHQPNTPRPLNQPPNYSNGNPAGGGSFGRTGNSNTEQPPILPSQTQFPGNQGQFRR